VATLQRVKAPRPCDGVAAALRNAYIDDTSLPTEMATLLAKLSEGEPRKG
jgi:hypothetical protein